MDKEELSLYRDEISPTFCVAKFHNAIVRVFAGDISTGCFHNPFTPLGSTLSTYYNPKERLVQQKEMLDGGKPDGCSYCWNVEALGLQSDRDFFSLNTKKPEPIVFYKNKPTETKPKYLELSFQKTCNLACSYCNPDFSTSWANDIRVNGPYDLKTDSRNHFARTQYTPVKADEEKTKLFWEWFDTIIDGLETIRITGGEPLLHSELFDVLDKAVERNPNIEVVVNSNLVNAPSTIDKFVEKISKFKNSIVYTSNEAVGQVAEFVRDGMDYEQWVENVKKVAPHVKFLCVMATPSAVALQSFPELVNQVLKFRLIDRLRVIFSINLVRHPEFQSLACLTFEEKQKYLHRLTVLKYVHEDDYRFREMDHLDRLIAELGKPEPENRKDLRQDLVNFFNQYCRRRNKQTNFVYSI